jgi:hypothetical protein
MTTAAMTTAAGTAAVMAGHGMVAPAANFMAVLVAPVRAAACMGPVALAAACTDLLAAPAVACTVRLAAVAGPCTAPAAASTGSVDRRSGLTPLQPA